MNQLEIQRLQRDHRRLDEEIQRVMKRPLNDPITLQRLKKQKLAIKDRLHRIVPTSSQVGQPRSDVGNAA